MFEPEPASAGHHQELSEPGHGFWDLSIKGLLLELNLEVGFPGQAAIEDSLNWVLVNLEDVGELEDESTSFVLFEAEVASEDVEA